MSIKNIVFDVGGVLVDFCYMEYMRKLGFSEEMCREFEKDIIYSELWNDMDRGDLMLEEAGIKFKKRLREMYKPCDDEVDLFIENIKDILSNYPRDLADMHWKDFKFLPVADGYIISAYERIVKPDEKIYRLLTEKFGIDLTESVFIDDRQINIDAANALGMKGILFKNLDDCMEALNKEGIIT